MYNVVALAGTFDRLHKGHRFFISEAFKHGERVIIALMSDEYVEKKSKIQNPKSKFKIKFQEFTKRKVNLIYFLKEKGLFKRAAIVKIHDVYGSAIEDTEIEALIVTRETRKGARKVNKRRKELRLSPLKIVTVPLIPADDKIRISSTRIRNGEIDRWGKVFEDFSLSLEPISKNLRTAFKKPIGRLIPKDMVSHTLEGEAFQGNPLITVGDEVTRYCNEKGRTPDIAIVDFVVNRIPKYKSLVELGYPRTARHRLAEVTMVQNPPGHIMKLLVRAIENALRSYLLYGKKNVVCVSGEEDLAGVPAILLAPLGSIVMYGQPHYAGIVLVEVTEKKKREIVNLIETL